THSGRRPRCRPRAPPSPGGFPSTARGVAPFAPTPTTSRSATGAHAVAGLVAAEAAVKYEHGEREPGERGRRHEAGERGPRPAHHLDRQEADEAGGNESVEQQRDAAGEQRSRIAAEGEREFPYLSRQVLDASEPERRAVEEEDPAGDEDARARHHRDRGPRERRRANRADDPEQSDARGEISPPRGQGACGCGLEEDGLGLQEQRVEVAVRDRARQLADPAGEHHAQAEARRDDTEQRRQVLEAPSADVLEAPEEDPPGGEEDQVVREHEGRLEPERAAQRGARREMGGTRRGGKARGRGPPPGHPPSTGSRTAARGPSHTSTPSRSTFHPISSAACRSPRLEKNALPVVPEGRSIRWV